MSFEFMLLFMPLPMSLGLTRTWTSAHDANSPVIDLFLSHHPNMSLDFLDFSVSFDFCIFAYVFKQVVKSHPSH